MPANLENFSKKRSWSVVVGAMRAHMGMKPERPGRAARGVPCSGRGDGDDGVGCTSHIKLYYLLASHSR